MTNPKLGFARYVQDEESQTDFFVSFLSWSNEHEVLNEIHKDDDIEFDESAEVVATQRDGLSKHPPANDNRRTLDWVVKDRTKIVGYESKCGDDLGSKQLLEERQKLEYNAKGREVHLFVFTEDIHKPVYDAEASWKRWSDVGKAVIDMEEKSTAIEMMTEMFKHKGYDGFKGFTEYRQDEGWFITHQNETVNLVLEAAEQTEGLRLYDRGHKHIDHHNRVQKNIYKVKENDYHALAPSYYVFSVHPSGYRETETSYNISNHGWYIAIVVPALHNTVYVEMHTYLSKDDKAREIIQGNAEDLTNTILLNDMHVHSSGNSLLKEESPMRYTDRDDIYEILSRKGGEKSWKRLRFGWEVNVEQSPEGIVEEVVRKMERLHEIFYDGVERRTEFKHTNSCID